MAENKELAYQILEDIRLAMADLGIKYDNMNPDKLDVRLRFWKRKKWFLLHQDFQLSYQRKRNSLYLWRLTSLIMVIHLLAHLVLILGRVHSLLKVKRVIKTLN